MPKTRTLLVVEDSADDAALMRVAFRKSGFQDTFKTVGAPEQAICYLQGEGPFADRHQFPLPDLVILDHEMPGNGWSVLKWIRSQPRFSSLPVVIFSGSLNPDHHARVMASGANGYYVKPPDFAGFKETMKQICETWLPAQAES